MFWKVYAVIYTALIGLGLAVQLIRLSQLSPIDLVDIAVFTPVAVASLWSVAFQHINLPKNTWKVLLFASVFWRAIVVGNVILFGDMVAKFHTGLGFINVKMDASTAHAVLYGAMAIAVLVAGFLTFPPIVSLYRNAYGNESLLKLMSPSPRPSRQTVA